MSLASELNNDPESGPYAALTDCREAKGLLPGWNELTPPGPLGRGGWDIRDPLAVTDEDDKRRCHSFSS